MMSLKLICSIIDRFFVIQGLIGGITSHYCFVQVVKTFVIVYTCWPEPCLFKFKIEALRGYLNKPQILLPLGVGMLPVLVVKLGATTSLHLFIVNWFLYRPIAHLVVVLFNVISPL
jgi:hypothetical protein